MVDVRPGAGGVELGGDRAADHFPQVGVDGGEHVVVRGAHHGEVERGVGIGRVMWLNACGGCDLPPVVEVVLLGEQSQITRVSPRIAS